MTKRLQNRQIKEPKPHVTNKDALSSMKSVVYWPVMPMVELQAPCMPQTSAARFGAPFVTMLRMAPANRKSLSFEYRSSRGRHFVKNRNAVSTGRWPERDCSVARRPNVVFSIGFMGFHRRRTAYLPFHQPVLHVSAKGYIMIRLWFDGVPVGHKIKR